MNEEKNGQTFDKITTTLCRYSITLLIKRQIS